MKKVLVSIQERKNESYLTYMCPACHGPHQVIIKRDDKRRPLWSWNGNRESPTLSPSIRVSTKEGTVCHHFVKAGHIEYCGDQPNDFKNKTVLLPELPESYR